MAKVRVFRYRVYDIIQDGYRYSTRMATAEQVKRIGGDLLPGTAAEIDTSELLPDGWTEQNFEPPASGNSH